jgi:hypothetical protein
MIEYILIGGVAAFSLAYGYVWLRATRRKW